MSYSKYSSEIEPRDPDLNYDEIAPGLYPDETVYELDTGDLIAVSLRADRQAENNGQVVIAWARAINEEGKTLLDTAGQELEIEYRHSLSPLALEQRDPTDIFKDVLHVVMGEPVATRVVDGDSVAWIALSEEAAKSLSIRRALQSAQETAGEIDVGDIL